MTADAVTPVMLSLGSNIAPEKHMSQAMRALRALGGLQDAVSSALYSSPAVGFSGPAFVNSAVRACWRGDLASLQQALRGIEDAASRDRSAPRFSSRTLDIDVVLFGQQVCDQGSGVPRDELLEHAFVLRPSAELAPDWVHPLTGQTLAHHWQAWRAQHDDPLIPFTAAMNG
ncbi:MAG: 2-amino-4-hydroxy-6-hydroxymethyldihydropteridine diphosphokinase [Oceanococcaceae bacterium]